jgi:hypothetical protein
MENQQPATNRPLTLGEMRVGISFNPGGHEQVNSIKRKAADLIDELSSYRPSPETKETFVGQHNEIQRLISLAQTHIEDAAMWGVKAVTK